ncbi:hypothetical protein [Paenibacillus thiaminolyticus]|uniref:Uncharacterized protein n=1 Tax=Paenibacillus thiaminolyticus TaxID=49283 RepID=A0A3A3GNF9_PANTH|nr:hypothetical protein [Paenibacillus thiaminolyticus]RJG26625.1 hypothetical protein DQX05_00890 [Paenibacillus thiaminolyticus]
MESYNFLLIPKENEVSFIDDLFEINGDSKLKFSEVVNVISLLDHVKPYIPSDISNSSQPECYYFYNDSVCIIEIEINSGIIENDGVEELSIRFAVTNPIGTFQKAIEMCEMISKKLSMLTIDMRLREVIDFSDKLQLANSKRAYETKREQFYKMYNLLENSWNKPTHCGKSLFEELRK